MTSRSAALLIVASALAACVALAFGSVRLADARHRADGARRRAETLARDASEALLLRASAVTVTTSERPADDIIPCLSAAMAEAGVPRDYLREVSPQGTSSTGTLRHSVRATLEPVMLPDLGRFLDAVRRGQRVWCPSQIELVGQKGGTFRAAVVFAAAAADQ
jgi:hypothetical protein